MRDIDAALVEQVLDVPERERVADNHHCYEVDDLGARFEIPKNAGAAHPVRLAAPRQRQADFPLTVPLIPYVPMPSSDTAKHTRELT